MPAPQQLVFDKYLVIRRIAVGGMGEIFLARQTGVAGFDRLVILKTMLPDLAEDEHFVEQFLDEARVAATLNHPNIVSIYEVGRWQDVFVISMEYIRGGHLGHLIRNSIKSGQPIPYAVSSRIVYDATMALDHAHEACDVDGQALNIVHRDVGLQNIMVRIDGVTKVVDFGVARAANRSTRTRTGLVKGKLPYMSPEQAAGHDLDGRSDQFSLGVVLWELIARRRLFKAETDLITLRKILNEPIPDPRSVDPNCPPELAQIVMRMLERDREQRFSRCSDVAAELRRFLDSRRQPVTEQVVASFVQHLLGPDLADDGDLTPSKESPFSVAATLGGSGPSSNPSSPQKMGRRGWMLAAALALLVTVTLGLGMAMWARHSRVSAAIELREPRGAQVRVDGELWGERLPTRITGLSEGRHVIRVWLDKQPALVKKIQLRPGETIDFMRAVPVDGTALWIREPKGAAALIDGEPWPVKTPTLVTGLSTGAHRIEILLEGRPPISREIELAEGRQVEIRAEAPLRAPTLQISSSPPRALVRVDGAVRGSTPLELTDLAAEQEHQVVVAKKGYEAVQLALVLQAGEKRRQKVTLFRARSTSKRRRSTGSTLPVPPPLVVSSPPTEPAKMQPVRAQPRGYGYLSVRTTPWTKIYVDGKVFGSTPLYKRKLAVGNYRVELVNEGAGIREKKRIRVRRDQTTKIDLHLGP